MNDSPANLVVVDIGNSHVSAATYVVGARGPATRCAIDPADAAAETIKELWASLPSDAERAVVVTCVCPPVLEAIRPVLARSGVEPVLVIGSELDLPIAVDLPSPEKVGTDRLCVAAAAFERIKSACVIADFGTALTVDLVADNGVFLGGTILPGMSLSAKALHEHTAALPLVEVGDSDEILGKDTTAAIRNGILAMMCGALREITERYAEEIGKWPPLVVTGGDAELIAKRCDFVDRISPDLCLDGVALAFQLAMAREQSD